MMWPDLGTVDPLALIIEAVHDSRNWQSSLAPGVTNYITLRNAEKDEASGGSSSPGILTADPLSKLEVVQQVAPLGIRIDKLGQEKIKDFKKFDLVASVAEGQSLQTNDVDEFFAPAMYLNLADDEKLSRKSYERMKAGQSFTDVHSITCGAAVDTEFEYDSFVYDTMAGQSPPTKGNVDPGIFQQWLGNGSIARSSEGRRQLAKMQADLRKPQMVEDGFVIIDAINGTPLANILPQKAMANAYDEVWKVKQANPFQKFRVVRQSELIP